MMYRITWAPTIRPGGTSTTFAILNTRPTARQAARYVATMRQWPASDITILSVTEEA